MRGLKVSNDIEAARAAGASQGDGPSERMMALLDDEGLTSVVATNCEQTYVRPLGGGRPGAGAVGHRVDHAIPSGRDWAPGASSRPGWTSWPCPSASVPAADACGDAEVQALYDAGEPVATMHFRILKFLPPVRKAARPPRPRPALTQDNAFWFEGAQAHRLLIQHCASCGTLRHPPLPACAVVRLARVGRGRVVGEGDAVLLRGGALPAGALVRVPAAHRVGGARGGDAGGGQPGRRGA